MRSYKIKTIKSQKAEYTFHWQQIGQRQRNSWQLKW
jgi:hypothetical protein